MCVVNALDAETRQKIVGKNVGCKNTDFQRNSKGIPFQKSCKTTEIPEFIILLKCISQNLNLRFVEELFLWVTRSPRQLTF